MIKKISLIIFVCSFILTIVLGNIVGMHDERIGGSAIDGYVENDKYFIMTYEQKYLEINQTSYYINLILWISMLFFGLVLGISGIVTVFTNLMRPAIKRMSIF